MPADDLAMQGARASVGKLVIYFKRGCLQKQGCNLMNEEHVIVSQGC